MNYIHLINWFWDEVPYRAGYKPHYGTLFFAIVDSCNRNNWRATAVEYDRMQNKVHLGKRMYYEALNWLSKESLIEYKEGRNDYAPAVFDIHQELKVEVQKCTSAYTSTTPQHTPLEHLNDTSAYTSTTPIIDKPLNSKTGKQVNKEPLTFPVFATELFHEMWAVLIQQPKWKNKSPSALQLSLDKLTKFNEPFALELMSEAIEKNWSGLVFTETQTKWANFQRQPPPRKPNAPEPITYAEMLAKPVTPQFTTSHFKPTVN